jgi:polar amino acid transport system substrate-binding protein
MRVRSFAAVLLAAIATLSIAGSAQTGKLKFVSTSWSPFTNEPGKARFALDLVEEGLGRIGVSSTTTIVEPASYTTELLTGSYDGSPAAWKDSNRERALLYSQPYLENRLMLVGRRGANVSATKLMDLKGKKVAIVGGYAYGDGVDAMGPTFVRSLTEENSLQLLLQKQVDYTLMDELVIQFILTNYAKEADAELQIGTTPLLTRPLHLVVRRSRTDAQSIISKFNAELMKMVADRTYHKLLHVEWISADINGDGVPEYVPDSDKAGASAPQHVYTLNSDVPKKGSSPHYYLGGKLYNSWTDVPDMYKVSDPNRPAPDRSTLSYFTFTWK